MVNGVIDFVSLTEKAKKISDRRSMLKAQEAATLKQLSDIEASLVAEYGEGDLDTFYKMVELIKQWDETHHS